jgi:hypothetical protein
LTCQSGADGKHQVVTRDEKKRDEKSGGAPTAPRARSNRHCQQGKRNASKGKRKPAMKFDARVFLHAAFLPENACGAPGNAGLSYALAFARFDLDGQVALTKCRKGIMVGIRR